MLFCRLALHLNSPAVHFRTPIAKLLTPSKQVLTYLHKVPRMTMTTGRIQNSDCANTPADTTHAKADVSASAAQTNTDTARSVVVSYDLASGETTTQASTQDARTFMLDGGSGAYTALRTVDGGRRVFLLSEHMQRLAQSHALLLHGTQPAAYWLTLVHPLLRQARDAFGAPGDCKLTVLVGQTHVHVQATRLEPPPASCVVRFAAGHRSAPEAKDLQWVHERARLERLITDGVGEVVLVDDGCFYEGLSSNFFATRLVGEGAGFADYELLTAPKGSVLLGTVMRLVLRICARDGVCVREDARVGADWSGAFVTSTSRGVLPVSRIIDGPPVAEDALVRHLRDSVRALAIAESTEL